MLTSILRGTTALVCMSLALPVAAQDDPGFLGTLVLTAGKRDLSFGTALSRTVVGEEEIKDRQASTVAQLIDSVPGVTLVNGTTPQGSGINIRGFGANTTFGSDQKIAVQIDGASVGSEELYRIGTQLFTDPLLYREVEVLRGTIGSFAYGSGIVGGVVKLETKDAADFTGGMAGFGGSETFEYASNGNGTVTSTNLGWLPTDRAEFLLNYSLRSQDNMTSGDGAVIGNSAFETPSYLAKAKVHLGQDDSQSLTISHSRTVADDKDVPYDQFATTGGSFGNVDRLTDTAQTTLSYRYDPASDLVDISAHLTHADQKIDSAYVAGSSPLEGTPSFGRIQPLADADHQYETVKLTLSNRSLFSAANSDHDMLAGMEFIQKERLDATSAPGGTDDRIALFAVDEITTGRLTTTPAVRYETSKITSANDLVDTSTTPATTYPHTYEMDAVMGGLALSYDLGGGMSVFGSGAYTEGLPIIDDLGTSATSQRRLAMSEKSRTLEFGAERTAADTFAPGDTLTLRGNFYRTTLWDITSYTVAGSMSDDLERVETSGLELEASYGRANGFYMDFAGHIGSGTEFNPDGSKASWRNTAADRAQVTLGRKWTENLDLSWELVHAADRRDSSGTDIADSLVHNLRATWRPSQGILNGAEIRVGAENLTNADYVSHLSSPSRKAPGRTLKLTLSTTF